MYNSVMAYPSQVKDVLNFGEKYLNAKGGFKIVSMDYIQHFEHKSMKNGFAYSQKIGGKYSIVFQHDDIEGYVRKCIVDSENITVKDNEELEIHYNYEDSFEVHMFGEDEVLLKSEWHPKWYNHLDRLVSAIVQSLKYSSNKEIKFMRELVLI